MGMLAENQGGQEYPTYSKRRKTNWTGHILHRNCLLKHVIERKMEGTRGLKRKM